MKTSKVKRFVFGALAVQGIVAVYGNSSSPNLSDLDALFGNALGKALDEETEKAVGEAEEAIHEFSIGCANACVPKDVQDTIGEKR